MIRWTQDQTLDFMYWRYWKFSHPKIIFRGVQLSKIVQNVSYPVKCSKVQMYKNKLSEKDQTSRVQLLKVQLSTSRSQSNISILLTCGSPGLWIVSSWSSRTSTASTNSSLMACNSASRHSTCNVGKYCFNFQSTAQVFEKKNSLSMKLSFFTRCILCARLVFSSLAFGLNVFTSFPGLVSSDSGLDETLGQL